MCKLTLDVKLNSINDDMKTVLADIVNEYGKLIPNGPPLGYKKIEVRYGSSGRPLCAVDFLPYYYQILLTVKDRHYCQAVYQFAHELCHIYCDPRLTNRFIESICTLSSFYFLDYMSKKWSEKPPCHNWKAYAQKFAHYKTGAISKIDLNLGEYSNIKNILKPAKSIGSSKERNLQALVAKELLPIFQEDPKAWLLLANFGRFSEPQPKTYNELCGMDGVDWKKLKESLPPNLKKSVEAILERVTGVSNKIG